MLNQCQECQLIVPKRANQCTSKKMLTNQQQTTKPLGNDICLTIKNLYI